MLENATDDMVATNTLPLNEIIPNKDQPRKTFDEGSIQELAQRAVISLLQVSADGVRAVLQA